MSRIKMAIIGCGRDAKAMHCPITMHHSDFEVAGTYDLKYEAAKEMADLLCENGNNCTAYTSMEELLASDIQMCLVLTDSHTHLDVCTQCLRAGKYVLVTKPWVLNTKEADQLINEAGKAKKEFGVELLVFLPMSWDPILHRIQKIVKAGEIGQVYQIRRRISTFGKRYDWQIYKKYGGGYLNNWGPHLLGQVMELVDEPITKICAEKKQVIMDGDCEDMFFAMMKSVSGVLINCEYGIMVDDLPHWTVQGSKGTIFVKDNVMDVHRITHPGPIDPTAYRNPFHDDHDTFTITMPGDNSYNEIYSHIAAVIRGEEDYRVKLNFTRDLTLLMESIHKSADIDDIVRISPDNWK